ncbi:MAG: acyl-CoA dehydratase activase [Clostridiales Family XIII bacterium]|jgi:predicted CoA-substrate-specific enzyme activase|nr:acyl-CoA dehydratase activase [Clostridiales Family XIII bacterium]
MVGYVCKYTPIEVFAGFGEAPSFLLPEEASYDCADSLMWPAVCGYAKSVLQCLHEGDGGACACGAAVFTDCCDAMKRVYDILSRGAVQAGGATDIGASAEHAGSAYAGAPPESAGAVAAPFMVWLPRVITDASIREYARGVGSFIERYEAYCGRRFDVPAFLRACARANAGNGPARDGEGYVALMGARAPASLMNAAQGLCALPVRNLTCGSGERKFSGIPDADRVNNAGVGNGGVSAGRAGLTDELLIWYAGELLAQTPCMRMNDSGARSALTGDPSLKAVVYHTIQFCDFYGFEYARLPQGVPALKLETDYTPASSGQLATRLQAFFESNGMLLADARARAPESAGPSHTGRGPADYGAFRITGNDRRDDMPNRYYAGVDSGSTSTNAVVIDADAEIVASSTVPTGADSAAAARMALSEALAEAHSTEGELAAIVATGYGRVSVPFAAQDVTEITCHAKGAHRLAPGARTVIDIGGQDSKVIRLSPDGSVTEFSMNDKCAAGTGRFLELMAATLGMDMDEMARAGLRPGETVDISSMCAVFAESEVISLIARGKSIEDIVWGVDLAIAGRVASMATRLGAEAPYVMTGGVANNAGVVKALGEKLRERSGRHGGLTVPGSPQICGALGAALIARDTA